VKEYWIVLPEESSVEVYTLKDSTFSLLKTYDRDDTLKSPLLQTLKIELKKIF
jgi:Uma2 family endonuclease